MNLLKALVGQDAELVKTFKNESITIRKRFSHTLHQAETRQGMKRKDLEAPPPMTLNEVYMTLASRIVSSKIEKEPVSYELLYLITLTLFTKRFIIIFH